MSVERLHPADVEAIAQRVVELLADRSAVPAPELVTAAEIARRFGVTADWVREHADELDVVRLGDGPRPRLRFDATKVAQRVARSAGEGSELPDRPRRRRSSLRARQSSGTGVPLLPIRDQEA